MIGRNSLHKKLEKNRHEGTFGELEVFCILIIRWLQDYTHTHTHVKIH